MKTLKIILCIALIITILNCGILAFLHFGNENASAWEEQYNLGVRYLYEGNYEEAILAFSAAIEIDPKNADAYTLRGDAYYAMGDYEEAQDDYETALDKGVENKAQVEEKLEEVQNAMNQSSSGRAIISDVLGYSTPWVINESNDEWNYTTIYSFEADGYFYLQSGWAFSEGFDSARGIYQVHDDEIQFTYDVDGTEKSYTYRFDPQSLTFTQLSEAGYFPHHRQGTVLHLERISEENSHLYGEPDGEMFRENVRKSGYLYSYPRIYADRIRDNAIQAPYIGTTGQLYDLNDDGVPEFAACYGLEGEDTLVVDLFTDRYGSAVTLLDRQKICILYSEEFGSFAFGELDGEKCFITHSGFFAGSENNVSEMYEHWWIYKMDGDNLVLKMDLSACYLETWYDGWENESTILPDDFQATVNGGEISFDEFMVWHAKLKGLQWMETYSGVPLESLISQINGG